MRHLIAFSFLLLSLPALSQSPPSVDSTLIHEANRHFGNSDYDRAADLYEKHLDAYPNSISALRGLAVIAYEKEDWGDVKEWNRRILEISPDDVEAQYRLGIAYRESGKFKVLMLKSREFGKSERYFQKVMLRDSAYRDVLYQRGLIEKYKENWLEAIEWARRQVRQRPELNKAHTGLFKFYRLFLHNEKKEKVARWLQSQTGFWPEYFQAELLRIEEQHAPADSAFTALLATTPPVGKYRVYLSLLRLHASDNNELEAGRLFEIVLDSMQTDIDAEFLYEDCKYIFSDDELRRFRNLADPAQKKEFFRTFWLKRDPTPAAPINVRAVEHYRRLAQAEKQYWFDGLRSWFNNPDKVGDLQFPEVYHLNEEFNDKGLIYIRHGEPDETASTIESFVPTNESWFYHRREDRSEFIFHFLIAGNAVGNNWRLTPFLAHPAMLGDRLGWSPELDRVFQTRSAMVRRGFIHEAAIQARIDVDSAMTSDSHSWGNVVPLTTPAYWSFFKTDSAKTRVEVYLGIPVDELRWESGAFKDVQFEHGAALFDSNLKERVKDYERLELRDEAHSQLLREQFIHRYVFEVEPGPYRLAYHARKFEPKKLGGGNFNIDVPHFADNGLGLSDIVLAYEIRPLVASVVFANRDLSIIPNPSREFKRTEPVGIYFEIYNLTADSAGETLYEIESSMSQLKAPKKFLGLFGGGKKKSISIRNRISGEKPDVYESTSFDVRKLDAGEYVLRVKVRDMNSGNEVEKSANVILTK